MYSFWNRRLCTFLIAFGLLSCSPALATSLPHHRLDISFDLDKQEISGTVDITVPENVRSIIVGSNLHIVSCTINGRTTPAKVKEHRITLPAHPGGNRVWIQYQGVFPNREPRSAANTISKEGVFLLGDWYPAAEAELSYFSLLAQIPRDFEAVSEADSVMVKDSDKERLVKFSFPYPVSNIHFIAARYAVDSARYRTVEIKTYLFPEDRHLADLYLASSKKYLEMYEKILGPYPFQRFAVVENILPTGYGMPTFTLIGRDVLRLPFIPETSLGHEILHCWFGNSVYLDYRGGNWSEGLTSYLADHYYRELKGDSWEYRKKIMEDYESYVHAGNEISLRDFIGGTTRALRAVGYGKAAMVFHMLKNHIGSESFADGVKSLAQKQRFQMTSWQDIERIFSHTAGRDLSGFFKFWLENKGAAAVNLGKVRFTQSEHDYTLKFTVRVSNCSMPALIPVVIRSENKEETKTLSVTASEQDFTFSFNEPPLEIILDPDYDLFRRLKLPEKRPVLSRLLGDSTRTVVLPETGYGQFEPLIQQLERLGFQTMPAQELEYSDLEQNAFLFLGLQDKLEFIFPTAADTTTGFSVEIKKNPFNPERVLGLVLAANRAQVQYVAGKLRHYGGYSTLKFINGKNVEKQTEQGQRGIRQETGPPATGIASGSILFLSDIIARLADKTVVYVGENHDRYGDHLMQLEVIRQLHRIHPQLAIGMEMFQRRYQKALDDYISGNSNTQEFLVHSRYFSTWRFNYHLYDDILHYARNHGIPIIALNQDNKLVSKVAQQGLGQLNEEEKARLPQEMVSGDTTYEKRLRDAFEMHRTELPGGRAPRNFEFFLQAQILWDETMAETIASFLADSPEHHLVVLAGSGHLAYGSGIPKRVYRRIPHSYAIVLPNPKGVPEPGMADFIVFPSEVEAPEEPKLGIFLDTSKDQLKVARLVEGGGAQTAGLKKGDIVLAVGDHQMKDIDHLKAYLATKYVGDRVEVTVKRGKKKLKLEVDLETPVRHHPSIIK
jgi:uncharacterized iron-regulated protein